MRKRFSIKKLGCLISCISDDQCSISAVMFKMGFKCTSACIPMPASCWQQIYAYQAHTCYNENDVAPLLAEQCECRRASLTWVVHYSYPRHQLWCIAASKVVRLHSYSSQSAARLVELWNCEPHWGEYNKNCYRGNNQTFSTVVLLVLKTARSSQTNTHIDR